VRVLAVALAVLSLGSSTSSPKVAYLRGSTLFIDGHVVATHVSGAVRWSGDGRLVSVGGQVVGGPKLSSGFELAWTLTGETAAYVTAGGGVAVWTPTRGARVMLPDGWGATGLAWGASGSLAIGRAICHPRCGVPARSEIWVSHDGSLRRVVGPRAVNRAQPVPLAWSRRRVLWWAYPNSASISADGVALFAGSTRIAFGLMYDDYVSVCGSHLAVAAGGDRFAMHGKRILFDGRDVSRDPSRSWVSPSCAADGRLVAAASVDTIPSRLGREHRAIWQLLPSRKKLTHPPAGSTDEFPRLLPDGSIVFVRTHGVGTIELLRDGRLTRLGTAGPPGAYYGHYDWQDAVAVAP
jgi:hypothetical protein